MKALALLLLVALPAVAEEEPRHIRDLRIDCGIAICTIVKEDLRQLVNDNTAMARELQDAAKPPKCAELEITEPSKNAPKKLPPIKRENDS